MPSAPLREPASLRSTASLPALSSCSQIRNTFHPIRLSVRPTSRSRLTFFPIFAFQNSLLVAGIERQRLHPCQKHPSKKIATRWRRKRTSGLPGMPDRCPSFQPLRPCRINSDRNLHSVDFVPCDLLRLITRERVSASNLSKGSLGSLQSGHDHAGGGATRRAPEPTPFSIIA